MDLECFLHQIRAFDKNKCNKGVLKNDIVQAYFQADSILAHRYKNNLSDFIIFTDSDFQAYAGPNSVMIKTAKIYTNKKKDTDLQNHISSFSIRGTINLQMEELQKLLSCTNEISWSTAEYPILNCSDHWICALATISLGCDEYPQGIIGFEPKQVHLALVDVYKNTMKTTNFNAFVRKTFIEVMLNWTRQSY